jgi:hypothetical protein
VTVELVPPDFDDPSRLIACSCCGLEYSCEHYKILASLNKLGYFYAEEIGISCHSCLSLYGKILAEAFDKECYEVEVIGENSSYILNFSKNP